MKHRAQARPIQQPEYIFQVESLSHEGRGIAHYGSHPDHPQHKHGKKVFIRYALPGETVRARITREVKKLEEADSLELLSDASEIRVNPVCPHFGICGGCNMQHIAADAQIELKQNVLKSHLQHFAGIQPDQWLAPLRSQREDYRRKARIGVRYLPSKDQLVVGFRENQSNKLTPIDRCMILDREFGSVTRLKQLLQGLNGKADIGHIELAMGDQDIALLVRETAKLSADDVNQLREFTLQKGWQLYLQPAGKETLSRIDDPEASARLHYGLDDFDVKFGFNPLDFTQVNSSINPQMVRLACDLLQLQQGERVLDLFCGLGNFSLPLARCVGAVLSLFHDIVVTLGIFAMMQWPFDLTVLAALLAIIGFSLNDNIVVSDRIRENFRKIRGAEPVEIINIALTETLRRTIHTSMTLLLVVLAMMLMGGDGLKWFSIAMFVGVFVGTYSSIYIGTAFALWRGLNRQDFIVQVKPEFEDENQIP
jgi:23S rRNA (uracil1939-C5)-methyltransferase